MSILKIRDKDGNIIEVPALKGDKGDKGDKGEDGADYILTEDDKNEIAAKANVVSYSEPQNLTDEQKEIARNNINAVDASCVKSKITGGTDIPNGNGLVDFFVSKQNFSPEQKQTARENIGAISQTELNEAIANVDGGDSGGFVSYSVTQNLTDEQKETARNNIGAVDASLVVSSLSRNEQIPNGAGVMDAIDEVTLHECVRCDVQQYLFEDFQEIARSNIGAVSQAELNEAIANAGGNVGGGGFVSYSVTQDLTDEQKATARGNINAVDASLVTDNLNSSEKIPNGAGLTNFLSESLHHFDVVSYNGKQTTTNKQKATARDNIEVDGGKWELLYTIEGDGETSIWEYTQFADGSPLKLTAVSAVIIQNVAEAEKSYGHLYAYCDKKSTQFPAAIYSYFTKNTAPTKPGTQRAYGVVEQYKGQYRAYSVGMAEKGCETMRYTPYMQGKSTTSDHPYIDHIKIHKQTGVFSTGNKIEVYGVRYYE